MGKRDKPVRIPYEKPVRLEVERMLSCGHSPAAIAASFGMSKREMRQVVGIKA